MLALITRRCNALNTGLKKPVGDREGIGRGVAVIVKSDCETTRPAAQKDETPSRSRYFVHMDNSATRNDPFPSSAVTYDAGVIERKWQRIWQERGTNNTDQQRA